MEDPLRKRMANSLILKLADPQAPLELPSAFYNLPHFIEKACDFVKENSRVMPDSVRERFEQAIKHARDLLDGVEVIEEWHLPHDGCPGHHVIAFADDSPHENGDDN